MRRIAILVTAAVPSVLSFVTVPALADVPVPQVVRIDSQAGIHGRPWNHAPTAAARGYVEEEFSFAGTAGGLAYTSRFIVRRPADRRYFNGTLLAEWNNVTIGRDIDVEFAWAHDYIYREGYAYVGVSAQLAGVAHLRAWDPVRYGHLHHPGDDPGSFDVFEQAVKAVLDPAGPDPFAGLKIKRVLAIGQSQSANRLGTYVNDPARVGNGLIDGFLLHSGGGAIWPASSGAARPPIRVLKLMAEDEGFATRLGDSTTFRLWEEAGTSHLDQDLVTYMHATRESEEIDPLFSTVCPAVNLASMNTLHRRFIFHAALDQMNRWIAARSSPPDMPRLETDPSGAISRDRHGNAIGGVRLPDMNVPIATHDNVSNEACPPIGRTRAFTNDALASLYPTHARYVAAYRQSAKAAVRAGYLLPVDASTLILEADARRVGGDL